MATNFILGNLQIDTAQPDVPYKGVVLDLPVRLRKSWDGSTPILVLEMVQAAFETEEQFLLRLTTILNKRIEAIKKGRRSIY